MEGKPPEQSEEAVREILERSQRRQVKPPSPVWRNFALAMATLLAIAVGAAYLWQWLHGLRGEDLLRFASIYLCIPMGVSLLLLFAALQKK